MQTCTSGGRNDTEQNELAVMPCTCPTVVSTVITVTPELKRPRAARNSCGVTLMESSIGITKPKAGLRVGTVTVPVAHYTRHLCPDGNWCIEGLLRYGMADALKKGHSANLVMNHSGTFVTTRSAEEVFDLVANPQRFSPLLPDFESMSIQDATHFIMRIAIEVGQIHGHVNLAMELREAVRPDHVEYRGQGIVAGSELNFAMQFHLAALGTATEVSWRGEVSVDGMLAFMTGSMIESMGRRNFELMAERLQSGLRESATSSDAAPSDAGLSF